MADKTDAKTKSTDVALTDDAAMQAFKDHIQGLSVEDPEQVQARILRNLMTAQTAQDVLGSGGVTPAADLIGVPLLIQGIRASNSDYEAGPDMYLHVDARIVANGDPVTFSTGARDCLLKLVRLDQLGAFPVEVVMRKASKPTKDGFYPIFLEASDTHEEPF